MPDQFQNVADQLSAPATRCVAVTPHNTTALTDIPKALYVGTGGTIVLRGVGSAADATFVNIADGAVLPVRASHVRATGTTASDIVALM